MIDKLREYIPPPVRVIDKQLSSNGYEEVCEVGGHAFAINIYAGYTGPRTSAGRYGSACVSHWSGSKWEACHSLFRCQMTTSRPPFEDDSVMPESAFQTDRDRLLAVAAEIIGVTNG